MEHRDEDAGKGAVEQDRRGQKTNVSFAGQNPHRDQDPLLKANDSDLPEPGQNAEHSGGPQAQNELDRDTQAGCGTKKQNTGFHQKENQSKTKGDLLAGS